MITLRFYVWSLLVVLIISCFLATQSFTILTHKDIPICEGCSKEITQGGYITFHVKCFRDCIKRCKGDTTSVTLPQESLPIIKKK